jgi:hypothetical protein
MQRIDLRAALAVVLKAHPHRQGEEIGEALLEPLLPAILRRISRITRPSRMRRNLSSRRARLNWWAWLYRPIMIAARLATRR